MVRVWDRLFVVVGEGIGVCGKIGDRVSGERIRWGVCVVLGVWCVVLWCPRMVVGVTLIGPRGLTFVVEVGRGEQWRSSDQELSSSEGAHPGGIGAFSAHSSLRCLRGGGVDGGVGAAAAQSSSLSAVWLVCFGSAKWQYSGIVFGCVRVVMS